MAFPPVLELLRRRPDEAQHVPGPVGSRALGIGLRTSLLAPLGAAAAVAVVAGQDPKAGAFVPLVVAIAILGIAVTFLPWDRMAGSAWGRQVLYVWAGLDLLLITLAGWSAAGVDAALPLGFGVTIVFFAVVFPIRGQAAFLAAMLACYAAVLLSTEFDVLSFAMLATLGGLACFLSREVRRRIDAIDRARVAAERRWAVTSLVAASIRDRPDADPAAVLQGVVEAVVSMGYAAAAIHVVDADDPRIVVPAEIDERHERILRSAPDSIRTAVLEQGRTVVVAAGSEEGQTTRVLRDAGLEAIAATPIIVEKRPGAILLVASDDPDPISQRELDAFAMLAAPAGLALVNAARGEDERPATGMRPATDPGAARLELVTQLSHEVRKPLGLVADAARALRGTDDAGERDRLVARLLASAGALEVTLSGLLDLSLLDAKPVELDMHELDLAEVVTRVAERRSDLFEDRELRLHAPSGMTVEADPTLIEQAIEHLLVAAATSTPPGRVVEVGVGRTDDGTVVTVEGHGTIPPGLLDRIEDPRMNGSGAPAGPVVRLMLASRIMQLHGTRLEIESGAQQRTRARFQLPDELGGGLLPVSAATPAKLTPAEAMLFTPAVLAAAADVPPLPTDDDEPVPPGRIAAAAAAIATAASTLVVTGMVPELPSRPIPVTVRPARDVDEGTKKGKAEAAGQEKAEKNDRSAGSSANDGGGGSAPSPSP
ncbi:MAG TPA: GAF domain-containing sensor histidine kinase [Actinomycetota bacterium]|nr:GAF domain-containing sensor histidine kinase [Actinomycetota bacterium]